MDGRNGLGDLLDAGSVLVRRGPNLAGGVGGVADGVGEAADHLAGPVDQVHSGFHRSGSGLGVPQGRGHGLLDLSQDRADLNGGLAGLLGEAAHLVGHYREAITVLTGSGGFDGRIDGQHVGLLGQVLDGGDDLADGLGLFGETLHAGGQGLDLVANPPHPFDRAFDGFPSAEGHLLRLQGQAGHRPRLLGRKCRDLFELLHGDRGLLHRGGLLRGRSRLFGGGRQDLRSGSGQALSRLVQGPENLFDAVAGSSFRFQLLLDPLGHGVEGFSQTRDLVIAGHWSARLDLASGHLLGGSVQGLDATAHLAAQDQNPKDQAHEDDVAAAGDHVRLLRGLFSAHGHGAGRQGDPAEDPLEATLDVGCGQDVGSLLRGPGSGQTLQIGAEACPQADGAIQALADAAEVRRDGGRQHGQLPGEAVQLAAQV